MTNTAMITITMATLRYVNSDILIYSNIDFDKDLDEGFNIYLDVITYCPGAAQVTQVVNLSPTGGWVTTSNVSTVVPPGTRSDLRFVCYASNAAVGVTETGATSVSVLCE